MKEINKVKMTKILIGVLMVMNINLAFSFEPGETDSTVLPPTAETKEGVQRIYPALPDDLEDNPSYTVEEKYEVQVINELGEVVYWKSVEIVDEGADGTPEKVLINDSENTGMIKDGGE